MPVQRIVPLEEIRNSCYLLHKPELLVGRLPRIVPNYRVFKSSAERSGTLELGREIPLSFAQLHQHAAIFVQQVTLADQLVECLLITRQVILAAAIAFGDRLPRNSVRRRSAAVLANGKYEPSKAIRLSGAPIEGSRRFQLA